MGVDTDAYRRVVGRFATGIAVVTTRADGVDHAMTVNSLTSVSLDPLLVLFCAEKVARFHDAVLSSGRWAVSILGEGAETTSRWFASRGRPLDDQLAATPFTRGETTGAAVLGDAIGVLECRTRAVYDGGDHTIVLGDVLSAVGRDGPVLPLLHYGGRYRTLAPEEG
ncbi:MAG: flavin reductase [Streptosporangiales bacterium]|nr:flavin reductase [Streptosporangiales bacterium]MBO0890719.1 flavin reductase [Acidothermales bacterium]